MASSLKQPRLFHHLPGCPHSHQSEGENDQNNQGPQTTKLNVFHKDFPSVNRSSSPEIQIADKRRLNGKIERNPTILETKLFDQWTS